MKKKIYFMLIFNLINILSLKANFASGFLGGAFGGLFGSGISNSRRRDREFIVIRDRKPKNYHNKYNENEEYYNESEYEE